MKKIIEKIISICQSCPDLKKAVLFGSRGRGNYKSTSDYDIALYLKADAPSTIKMKLLYLLDEVDCLQKIDALFVTDKIDEKLLENIEKEGVVLMERSSKKENFLRAVKRLEEAVKLCQENPCDFYYDALIQRFEFSTELAWKTCKEHLQELGYTEINGPKPAMREAFSAGLIEEDEIWISILTDRNLTSHIYDEETAREIALRVMGDYVGVFRKLAMAICEI